MSYLFTSIVIVPWHQVIQNVIEELFANHRQGFTARNVFRLQPFPSIKSARGKENIRSFLLMQDKSPAIRYIIHPLHNTDIILQDDKFYNFTYLQNVYWVFSFIPDSDLNGTPLRTVGWSLSPDMYFTRPIYNGDLLRGTNSKCPLGRWSGREIPSSVMLASLFLRLEMMEFHIQQNVIKLLYCETEANNSDRAYPYGAN